ncbi:pentatricopeptide repeat-containing protein [Canna indica]|uniref:Pentatricopeptide repeat-containing protein n=1 Tax=Canna indica TaxID=4628 RepID=A0AAQ3KEL4_9LILI|nr:pentatricopeptide repeat-containing protein [Canna indica]
MRWYRFFPASIRLSGFPTNSRMTSSDWIAIARFFSSQIHHNYHLNGGSICSKSQHRVVSHSYRSNLIHTAIPTRTASGLYSSFKPQLYSSSSELLVPGAPNSCSSIDGSGDGRFGTASNKVYEALLSASGSGESLENALDVLDIELTTELVDDVLQMLRYEEKLAFRFFTWAGRQYGYSHEPHTYNFMIDVLSSTNYKAKQFGVVCDILDYMKRNNKSSVPVNTLVTILRTYTEKHLTHLRKFAKKKRIKMRTPPETDAFNLLVDALCKCSLVKEAENMFHRLKSKVTPNAETYNIMFFGWCRVRDPKKAMKVLEEMIKMGHTPENFTYNAAIDSFCSSGMVSEARELFEFMRNEGSTISSPTAKTYSLMIIALAKSDQLDECFKLLAVMRVSGCLPDVSTYKEIVEGMCLAGKVDAAYKVLEMMAETGFRPDILTYNCFLKVLCNLKKAGEAIRLCEKMIEAGCEPSVHTYNMLITMYFEMGEPDRAVYMWQEMERRGCARVPDTYGIMILGLFNCDREDDACFLLAEIIERQIKLSYPSFDSILSRLSKIGNLSAIHQLSEHMRRFYNVAMSRRFAISQKKRRISLRRI